MKKALLLFMTMSTLALTAQNIDPNKEGDWKKSKTEYSPEQRAELRSKQMTLDLNLKASQQIKVKELFLKSEQGSPKISKKKSEFTTDEKFELRNSVLDQRITMQKELKKILNEEQFQKWEKSNYKKTTHSRKKRTRNKVNSQ